MVHKTQRVGDRVYLLPPQNWYHQEPGHYLPKEEQRPQERELPKSKGIL